MYQPLKHDAPASPAGGATLRTVSAAGMDYPGSERRMPPAPNPLAAITPFMIIGWVRKFWLVAIAMALLGAFVGLAAGSMIKPRYTSYSDILLDPTSIALMADDPYSRAGQPEAQVIDVESKMRVMTSISVLARVVDDLGLAGDEDLVEPGSATADEARTAAIRELGARVRVSREERSYVVTASVWAHTPEKSVALTDAVVAAFLAELAAADSEGARSASAALGDRLAELREEAARAESAVNDYRRENGLPTTSDGQLSTRSAVQINAQVDAAREGLIAAEARYASLASGGGGNSQTTELLAQLRTDHAAAKQRVDALSATLGPRHPSLATARAELAALKSEVDNEVARIVDGARTDLQRARDVFDQLSNAAGAQLGNVFTDERAQLELRQLERTAASTVTIYEAFLNRAQQVAERSQINTSKVRVISPAVAPLSRTYPPRTIILIGLGLFVGLSTGLALAAGLGFLGYMRPITGTTRA